MIWLIGIVGIVGWLLGPLAAVGLIVGGAIAFALLAIAMAISEAARGGAR